MAVKSIQFNQHTLDISYEIINPNEKVDLIMLLDDNGYPPVNKDEVYKEIFEQVENFKKYNTSISLN